MGKSVLMLNSFRSLSNQRGSIRKSRSSNFWN